MLIALRSFDVSLMHRVNALSEAVHGTAALPLYRPPAAYTGEAIGIEYLHQQAGTVFGPREWWLGTRGWKAVGLMLR